MNLLQTKLKKCFKNGPFRCLKTGNICETYDFFSLEKRTMWKREIHISNVFRGLYGLSNNKQSCLSLNFTK